MQHVASVRSLVQKMKSSPISLPGCTTFLLHVCRCSYCPALARLPKLPGLLHTLDCSYCERLKHLPVQLLSSLTDLYVSGCNGLARLPCLPPNLPSFTFGDSAFSRLPAPLPSSLTELRLWRLPSLTTVPTLPVGLNRLDLDSCTKLVGLPGLASSLEVLGLHSCSSLAALPAPLPPSLRYIDCTHCPIIGQLPDLQGCTRLTRLHLSSCGGLTSLCPGPVPDSLEHLCLDRCTGEQQATATIAMLCEAVVCPVFMQSKHEVAPGTFAAVHSLAGRQGVSNSPVDSAGVSE